MKKRCIKCQKWKLVKYFYKQGDGKYFHSSCKKCFTAYHKYRQKLAKHKAYRRSLKFHLRKVKRKYGLSKVDWFRLLKLCSSACPICLKPFGEQRPCVDHDHSTGKVRGLLCFKCNFVVGLLDDDYKRCRRVISYLKGAFS